MTDPAPTTSYPSLSRLIPHTGPMLLIDALLNADVDAGHAVVRAVIRPDSLFARASAPYDGGVSPLIALELFAQSAAALVGYRSYRIDQTAIGSGALLGTRKLDLFVDALQVDDVLTVEVQEKWGMGGLAQLEGVLYREGDEREKVAEGIIHVAAGPVRG